MLSRIVLLLVLFCLGWNFDSKSLYSKVVLSALLVILEDDEDEDKTHSLYVTNNLDWTRMKSSCWFCDGVRIQWDFTHLSD
jgi:hypothetical protein